MTVSEAIAQVIQTYPGWTLFCALCIGLALIKGAILIARKDLH